MTNVEIRRNMSLTSMIDRSTFSNSECRMSSSRNLFRSDSVCSSSYSKQKAIQFCCLVQIVPISYRDFDSEKLLFFGADDQWKQTNVQTDLRFQQIWTCCYWLAVLRFLPPWYWHQLQTKNEKNKFKNFVDKFEIKVWLQRTDFGM